MYIGEGATVYRLLSQAVFRQENVSCSVAILCLATGTYNHNPKFIGMAVSRYGLGIFCLPHWPIISDIFVYAFIGCL